MRSHHPRSTFPGHAPNGSAASSIRRAIPPANAVTSTWAASASGGSSFRECQIEEAAVISEELNPEPAEHGLEIGRRELKLAGAHHASARHSEAVKIVGGSGDRFASDPHTAGAGKSTEISNDCVRFRGDASHAAT